MSDTYDPSREDLLKQVATLERLLKERIRCAYLDMHSRRCTQPGTIWSSYHGDNELYDGFDKEKATWVRVAFCKTHGRHELENRKYRQEQKNKRRTSKVPGAA